MGNVGFVIPIEQCDEVLKALKVQESKFTYGSSFLSVISIDIVHAARVTVPKHPVSANVDAEHESASKVDPFVNDDPWRGHAAKLERLTSLRARIAKPIADTRRTSSAHSGLSPELIRK